MPSIISIGRLKGQENSGVTIEELLYEGYGPGGVGLIVKLQPITSRSASEVRSTFSKGGGNLAGVGALALTLVKYNSFGTKQNSEDELTELALENEAEDVLVEDDITR